MELTPAAGGGNARTSHNALIAAECRCPPGTAQYHDSTSCYKLYEQGPCDIGQYFAPVNEPKNTAIMYVVHVHVYVYGVKYTVLRTNKMG